MNIASGEIILASDLNAGLSGYALQLSLLAGANTQATNKTHTFYDLDSGTGLVYRQVSWVPNDDFETIQIGCSSYDENTTAQVTATLTGPLLGEVELTGTHTADYLDLPTYTNPQVLLKGATYTWTVATTASSGRTRISPYILIRNRVRRD